MIMIGTQPMNSHPGLLPPKIHTRAGNTMIWTLMRTVDTPRPASSTLCAHST